VTGPDPGAPPDAADELLLVISADDMVASRRRRAARPEATTTLALTIPEELAQGLQEALAVLPGADLDSLASRALRQVVEGLGLPGAVRRPRRRHLSGLIVLI